MQPIVVEPYLRPMVWGGRKLGTHFGKSLPSAEPYGESWELSVHPHHVSRVANGPWTGMAISELFQREAEALFGQSRPTEPFPLLVKLLDCHDWLSVQVHPNDQLARELTTEQFGKSEAWVVLQAEPTAKIFAGLREGVSRELLEARLASGEVEQVLHSFRPEVGDCLYLPAGTVHAVGGGVVLAEVQQSSDATFRLFDWNRRDAAGRQRELHLTEAFRAIDWQAGPVTPVTPEPIDGLEPGVRVERLVDCCHFQLVRWNIPAEHQWHWRSPGRLGIWLVLDGSLRNVSPNPEGLELATGQTVLMPAGMEEAIWKADTNVVLLEVRLPEPS